MSLSVFDRQRRSPSFAEALAANPPPPAAGDVAGQQRRHEARAAFEASEKAAREAEKERADRDWNERAERERMLEERAQAKQAAWMAEKTRLEAELDVARRASAELPTAADLSSVESAIESAKQISISMALSGIVLRAEGALAAHRKSNSIR